jgi:hypothetical protein
MTDPLCNCGDRDSQHAEPTLFNPHRGCKAKWWVDGKNDCICGDFIPAQQSEAGAEA